MHPDLRALAAKQQDLVARWQLIGAGWTRRMIEQILEVEEEHADDLIKLLEELK